MEAESVRIVREQLFGEAFSLVGGGKGIGLKVQSNLGQIS